MDTGTILLLVLGLVAFLIVLILIVLILSRILGRQQPAATQPLIDAIRAIQEIRDMMAGEAKVQDRLQLHIQDTLRAVEGIKTDYEARKRFDEANRESIKSMEQIIAGTKTKGIAGENILREAFKSFPPEMVRNRFKIRGKEVEFGMMLVDKKIVPIDSKWPSTDLLDRLSREEDQDRRLRIMEQIEKEVTRRVSEVAQYIDPDVTVPWAIAAIPDSAFSVCKDAHINAFKKNVILISYSLAIPYLLTLFNLHLQYSSSIDIQNLGRYLMDIKRHLDEMDEILENKIEKAGAMIDHASSEYRQILGSIKGSIATLESSRPKEISD